MTELRLARTNREIIDSGEVYTGRDKYEGLTVLFDESANRFRSYDSQTGKIGGYVKNSIGQEIYKNSSANNSFLGRLKQNASFVTNRFAKYAAITALAVVTATPLGYYLLSERKSEAPNPKGTNTQYSLVEKVETNKYLSSSPISNVPRQTYIVKKEQKKREKKAIVPIAQLAYRPNVPAQPISSKPAKKFQERKTPIYSPAKQPEAITPTVILPVEYQTKSDVYIGNLTNIKGMAMPKQSEYEWDSVKSMYVRKQRIKEIALMNEGKTAKEAREIASKIKYFDVHSTERESPLKFNSEKQLYEQKIERTDKCPAEPECREWLNQYIINAVEIQGRRTSKESFEKAGKEAEKAGKAFSKFGQPEYMAPDKTGKKAWNAAGDFLWNTFVQFPHSLVNIPNWISPLNDKDYSNHPGWFRPFMYAGRTVPLAANAGIKTADIPTAGMVGAVIYPTFHGLDHSLEMVKDGVMGIANLPRPKENRHLDGFFDIPETALTLGFNIARGKGYTNMEKQNIDKMAKEKGYFGVMLELGLGGWLTGECLENILEDGELVKSPGRSGGSGESAGGMGRGGGSGIPNP